MTFAELVAYARDQFGTDLTVDEVGSMVNERYRTMVTRADFRLAESQLATSVAGQSRYAISDDAHAIRSVYLGDDGEDFGQVTHQDIRQLKASTALLSGVGPGVFAPGYSSTGESQIDIYPAPDQDGYAINGLVSLPPADLSGSDEPAIPEEFHRPIGDGVIALILEVDHEHGADATPFANRYEAAVEGLRIYRKRKFSGQAVRVRMVR